MSEIEGDEEGNKIRDAIADALSKNIGKDGLVTRWFTVAEVIDQDGERGLWAYCDANTMRWDIYGMLEEIRQRDNAHVLLEDFEGHGHGPANE